MSKKQEDKHMISPVIAETLISQGADVHTFRNPNGMLMGCDISRRRLREIFAEFPNAIEIGGEACKAMKHAIVVVDGHGPLFIETDMEKLEAFEVEVDKPDDYVPYGPEWEKEMMKHTKKFIIELFRKKCLENEQA